MVKIVPFLHCKTRFYYMFPIKNKSSKLVYMKINQLHKWFSISFRIFSNLSPLVMVVLLLTIPFLWHGSNASCNGLVRTLSKKGYRYQYSCPHYLKGIDIKNNEKKRIFMVINFPLSSSYKNVLPFCILLILTSIFHSSFYLQFGKIKI